MKKRTKSSSGITTGIAVLVVIVIILAAGVFYFAEIKSATPTSTVVTSPTPTSVVSTSVSTATSVCAPPTVATSATTATATEKSVSNPLLLYSADSQVNESGVLEAAFTANTRIPIITANSGGSLTMAADIAAGDPVSVFISISKAAVEVGDLGATYPGWAIAYAGDQFDLAYTSASTTTAAAETVLTAYNAAVSANTTHTWYVFFYDLTSGSVKVGISNPVLDPAGYRGWLSLELAGIAYDGGIANEQFFANRMLANNANVTGASAAALVPALETGAINFLFYYKSAIVSGGLDLIQLAEPVNLGVGTDNTFYGQATYTVSPGTVETGSAITIWITVPNDSTDPTDAVNFVVFVIENRMVLLQNFQLTVFAPAHLYNDSDTDVPAPIVALLNSGSLGYRGCL